MNYTAETHISQIQSILAGPGFVARYTTKDKHQTILFWDGTSYNTQLHIVDFNESGFCRNAWATSDANMIWKQFAEIILEDLAEREKISLDS